MRNNFNNNFPATRLQTKDVRCSELRTSFGVESFKFCDNSWMEWGIKITKARDYEVSNDLEAEQ